MELNRVEYLNQILNTEKIQYVKLSAQDSISSFKYKKKLDRLKFNQIKN